MLITCPRCGFNQPKDRYCAQCGLDIENYKPPQTPFLKKVFGDPLIQIAFVLVIALLSGLYFYKSSRKEIQERVTFFNKGIQYSKSDNSARSSETEGGIPAVAEPQAAEMAVAQQATPPPTSEPAADVALRGSTPKLTNEKSKAQINIQYAEIPSRTLAEVIYFESRQSGQFNSLGDHVSGVWLQGKKKLNSLKGFKVITRDSKNLESQQVLQFFAGLTGNEPENDIGLTTYLEISDVEQSLNANLEVVRSWRELSGESAGTVQRKFFPAVVELPVDAYFFLVGALPRDNTMMADPYLTNIDPFKILKTNPYRTGETEFIILIDFDK